MGARLQYFIVVLVFLFVSITSSAKEPKSSDFLEWSELPPLPPAAGQTINPGVAGAYAGICSNNLIIAGGANFAIPVTDITNGAAKIYHDTVYCMEKTDNGCAYIPVAGKLPFPLAYGASVTIPQGVLLLGGQDAEGAIADVLLLSVGKGQLKVAALPPLPKTVSCTKAVLLNGKIYLAGGSSSSSDLDALNNFWSFDLTLLTKPDFYKKSAKATKLLSITPALKRAKQSSYIWGKEFAWQSLPNIPGDPRSHAMVSVQHDGYAPSIYIMGGRRKLTDKEVTALPETEKRSLAMGHLKIFDEVYKFNFGDMQWKACTPMPSKLAAGVSISSGQGHIFVLSGATGEYAENWETERFFFKHPGFMNTPYIYHAITDTWIKEKSTPQSENTKAAVSAQLGMKTLPDGYPVPVAQVTAAAVNWDSDIILIGGEVRPGVRTPAIRKISLRPIKVSFGIINYTTLVIYLLGMVGIGVYFSRKNKSTNDFFRGGQNIPWWAAACSIYATMLSSITFVAMPAKAFATDWSTWIMIVMVLPVSIFVIAKILPFFRQIDATSAYEYLQKRFNYTTRMAGSILFVLFQIGRMAVVMYLPALALQAITGLSPITCILIMGVLSIIYCTMGGIEAVIWTDTIQTFVLLGGALLSVLIIIFSIEGGVGTFMSDCIAANKFKVIDWDFSSGSYMTMSIWVVVLGGIFQNLASYSADQSVVQRYMTTPDLEKSSKSILMNGYMCAPAGLLFFAVGAALFSFYKHNPDLMNPVFAPKSVFPLFIATKMPIGISGLVVAGIFAAAQSTLSTSMNSLSTTLVTDFARPMNACKTDKGYLTLARIFTAIFGIVGTLAAIIIACSDIFDVFDQYMAILGMFMGVLGGMFILGMFSKRANSAGCIIAATISAIFMCWLKFYSGSAIHGYLYPAISLTMTYVLGLLISLVTGGNRKNIDGLTVFK
ncbi:MAG: sodium/solute symporter [Kiritimatiellae bacterium]|jgi:SSS family solute:Na+ symporter|nr:sodium/solute symporter [Kiritimatiellia bacterium]